MSTYDDTKNAAESAGKNADNPWPKRFKAFQDFSEQWHTRGSEIEFRYEDVRDSSSQLSGMSAGSKKVNLFFANVLTIREGLFNSLPKPAVSRLHFGDWDNEPARVAALIVERALTFQVKNAPHFEMAIKNAIQDRLVPGLGSSWITFTPTDGVKPAFISVDYVYWKDLMWDPQRTWEASTWVGRKVHMRQDVADKRFGTGKVSASTDAKPNKGPTDTPENAVMSGKVCVVQVWDKESRKMLWTTKEGEILETTDDPYKLKDFYPTPKPLISNKPTRLFLPIPDYYIAQDQYISLDTLFSRICLIIDAIKVAGVYDASNQSEIGRMLDGAENKLIPVDNWAMLAEKGGLRGALDWYPVEQVATVLQHLVSAYGFIKTELFEVSGMSDIVRGSSNQYETAAAQQIKAQFASVRMNGYQRDTAIYVRDILRIIAEITVQMYSRDELSRIVGQLPQSDQQFVEPALQLLQNDFLSGCNIDIEADSLTQADWGLEQQQRMAYIQALSPFIQQALPMAKESPQLAPLLVTICKFASQGFKGASELEGALDSALNQLEQLASQPPPPGPEQQKMEMEKQKQEGQMKLEQGKAQMQLQLQREKNANDIQMERERNQIELEKMRMEMMFERESHMQEMQFAREKHEMDMVALSSKTSLQVEALNAKTDAQINAAQRKEEEMPKPAGKEET